MVDGDILTGAAGNCGEAYRYWAERLGRPWRMWDDLVVADLGLPVSVPPNNATLLRPLSDGDVEGVIDRIAGTFDGSPGGPFQIWSAWPTPDLSRFGFAPWGVPLMIRPSGGEPTPAPPGLEIVEVDDDRSALEASIVIGEAFGVPPPARDSMVKPALRGDAFRFWLGRVDGRPVSAGGASVSHGLVGVYAVATVADARGRGYGEALTWAATMFRPDLPATLQASPMGEPVYARMGFETVGRFSCWSRARR